ncbi:response regulator transcription factor [Cyanobium sp. Alchichica 3B3-8F6]|uniref:winged helix-turn-helix domain-containing protein n=1 Tax=Cyanobium sp. Alchichica 3B3-8F6 TaxID=2823696 RepID=UPI0020CBBD08|nr:response regulator transcription factor [Cyanobium sp. Alchichica 3B3-8F6]MCP9883044.1 response regulator transcription factor [Cyanobium sp. Alchichica 3B3-8F6]
MHSDPAAAHRLRHDLAEAGCEVCLCRDVDDAAEQLATPSDWELLVLDGSLGAQAAALCARVRAAEMSIPVLMLCPGSSEADRIWGLEVGADDVLPEPFGMAECLARCRALVRRHQLGLEATPELRCGAVTMRVEAHRVSRDGQDVTLSPREFRLLQFFLEHPRRIWSRDELLTRVWGELEAVELDPKTVDVHIRWLRLKLEADPAQPALITTVRGQGYRCG